MVNFRNGRLQMTKQEFKVGQRVLVRSGANLPWHCNKTGVIIEVDEKSPYQPNIKVLFDDGAKVHCYPIGSIDFDVEALDAK